MLTSRNIEYDFAEPFVSAIRVVSVEEKKTTTDNPIKKPEVVNVPDIKLEQAVTQAIIFTDGNTKEMKVNDLSDVSFKGQDLMELARNTVNCLGHISENYYFGITVLICVLRGGKTKQIIKHKLNEVPEYGIYADMSRDDMRAVVQWMLNNHYMLKTKAKYPVLHPTYDGNHFDECITKKQIRELKRYLDNPNREIFDDDSEESKEVLIGSQE